MIGAVIGVLFGLFLIGWIYCWRTFRRAIEFRAGYNEAQRVIMFGSLDLARSMWFEHSRHHHSESWNHGYELALLGGPRENKS